MKITKQCETKLNLNGIEMFSGGLDSLLMDKLREKFVNRCEKQCYITEINKIHKRSMVVINKDDLGGGGSVSIQYIANAVVYPSDCIVVGCKVDKINRNGSVLCSTDSLLIELSGAGNISLTVGNSIIVRIIETDYPKGSSHVVASGELYQRKPDFNLFIVVKPQQLPEDSLTVLQSAITEAKTAYEQAAKISKEMMEYINSVLYPFNKQPENIPKQLLEFDILKPDYSSIPVNKHVIISRPGFISGNKPSAYIIDLEYLKSSPSHAIFNKEKLMITMTSGDFVVVMLDMILDFTHYCNMLCSAAELYATESMRKQNEKIWTYYTRNKISAF